MSKRLFVDCDDTIILYTRPSGRPDGIHPYGVTRGVPHVYNRPLVNSVRAFIRDHPNALVVVWSGGGAEYARTVANIALPGMNVAAMDKGMGTFDLVRPGDIVVDDQPLLLPTRVFKPDEWVYNGTE